MQDKFDLTFSIRPANIAVITAIVDLIEGNGWHGERDILGAVVQLEYMARRKYPLLPWPQLPPADVQAETPDGGTGGPWLVGGEDVTNEPLPPADPPTPAELERRAGLIRQALDDAMTPAAADTDRRPEDAARLTSSQWFNAEFGDTDGRYIRSVWRRMFGTNRLINNMAKDFQPRYVSQSKFANVAGIGVNSYTRIRAALIRDGYIDDVQGAGDA